ncbi:hypothetical protein ABW19_dt0208407 [Dactylella cylindrospora]|nr:hypothetical protein ABW19_dt0208407 [Dactylella cylindrospora]
MATVIQSRPRHVLTPLSPKKRTVLGNVTNIVRGFDVSATQQDGKGLSFSKPSLAKKPLGLSLSTTTNISKRPFCTIYDENSTTQAKRMKSQTSHPSCEENTIPKYALVTKPVSPVPSGIVVSKKKSGLNAPQTSLKRRTHVPSSSSASTIGSSGRSAAHSSAISRKDSLATLTTSPSKGIKRKIQKTVRRVDPPANLSKSGNDIGAASSIDGRLIATPVAKSGNTTAGTWRPGQPFPKSWMFDIHEDTLEETLTNLMYHGAGVLDISDEEDLKKGMSEADRVGKENIPPAPTEDRLAMPPPPAPGRGEESDMDSERTRSPLGDVDVEVFYPSLKKEREEAEILKKMKEEEKKNGMMQSKFAVIEEIVADYMKQKKETSSEDLSAAEVPLPADDEDDLEEEVQATAEDEEVKSVEVPKISVENCDFDDIISSQTRSMAEDELFDDDL